MRALFIAKYMPKFMYDKSFDSWGLVSIPLLTWLGNITIDEIYLLNMMIQVNDPDDH